MANELQLSYSPGKSVYFLIRNRTGSIWSTSGGVGGFEVYATANYADYKITGTEQGTQSAYYLGNMPAAVLPGIYSIVGKQQLGGTAAETDPTVAGDDEQWNGVAMMPLSDLATSGQVGGFAPIRLARSWMIQNFPLYLKSAADHVTPFTSGIVSGQIARDGGNFGPLQSGSFTEIGLGFYNTTLTSGDLGALTVKMLFTANGVSGGTSDPLPMTAVLQRISGF